MKQNISLSLFFPAYNEEANITASVKQAEAVLKDSVNDYEIIIVDDGSTDRTPEIADELAKKNPRVKVVHHSPNQGYGAAVWSGITRATKDYVFFTDADLQFDLKELPRLLAFVPEYKVVLGYRAKRQDPFMRLLNAKGWNVLNRLLFGLKVKDIDCAFKLFERKLIINLPIKSRGAMMSAELLIHLQRQGVPFKEVPVTHLPRIAGSPTGAKISVIRRAFKELLQTYRGDLGNVTQRQLVKFSIVGGFNTLLDLLIYFILTRNLDFFEHHLILAKIVSYGTGSVTGFLMNRQWTFRRKGRIQFHEVGRFYVTVVMAILINAVSLFVLLRLFNSHDLPAVVFATIITFMWNFTISKFWVFSQRTKKVPITIPRLDMIILAGIILIVAVGGVIWLQQDDYPPHWDMSQHLMNSYRYVDTLNEINHTTDFNTLAHKVYHFFIGKDTYYPPFMYWLSVPFVVGFRRTMDGAVYTNIVPLIVLVFSLYGIGKKLWNRQTGLLAALVIVSYPFIASQFHEFQLDMPLLAMTSLAFYCLLASERFRHSGWSFFFGVISGLAMLTKWPLPAFLIGPVLYELIGRIREIKRGSHDQATYNYHELGRNIGLGFLGFILTAGPWYEKHLGSLRHNLDANWQIGSAEGDPDPFTTRWFRFYIDGLIISHIRGLMLVPLLVGIYASFRNRITLHKNGILLTLLISSYVIMTIYNNKDYRFIEPVMIAVAVLSVFWISQLRTPMKQWITGLIVIVALFNYLSSSWGTMIFPFIPPKVAIPWPSIDGKAYELPIWRFAGYTAGPPRHVAWPQRSIIDRMVSDAQSSQMNLPIEVAMYYKDNISFNEENMRYYIYQANAPIELHRGQNVFRNCSNTNYILATSEQNVAEQVAHEFPYYPNFILDTEKPDKLDIKTRLNTPQCQLNLLFSDILPDGNTAYIWKVRPQ
jgi:glycosyltransferase involved in cell wall biosynthesis